MMPNHPTHTLTQPAHSPIPTHKQTTRECFVFKFHPEFTVYPWTGKNDYFVLTNAQHLAMGGGGSFAFQVSCVDESIGLSGRLTESRRCVFCL